MLIVRMGITTVVTDLFSGRGEQVLRGHKVTRATHRRIERLRCRIEELLDGIEDLREKHALVLPDASKSPGFVAVIVKCT